jgi:metal-responsive CopG/Arc/MetJ family transcriptional regulator
MARKKGPGRPPREEPGFERIELQVPPGFIARVDEAAKKLGLSRSAYIRFAVNQQIQRDRQAEREAEGGGE